MAEPAARNSEINALAVARRFELSGRKALVTGGSLSIGRAIALGLAEAGADIAIQYCEEADRALGWPDAAQHTKVAIENLGARVELLEANFRDPGAATGSVRAASEKLGQMDILVIAASTQTNEPFSSVSVETIARHVAINFAATFELLQAALPGMAKQAWGRVLSIGSVNQVKPGAELSVYAALKAAQHNLIVNLARQYAERHVTLNTLSPGLVATARNRWRRADQNEWDQLQKRINPMRRAAEPEEMVGAALLLCSDAGSFITGADLQVTGGGHL